MFRDSFPNLSVSLRTSRARAERKGREGNKEGKQSGHLHHFVAVLIGPASDDAMMPLRGSRCAA